METNPLPKIFGRGFYMDIFLQDTILHFGSGTEQGKQQGLLAALVGFPFNKMFTQSMTVGIVVAVPKTDRGDSRANCHIAVSGSSVCKFWFLATEIV